MTGRDPSSRFPARTALLATACLLRPARRLRPQGAGAPKAADACGDAAGEPATHLPEGIAWFDGEVEAAFAAAKAADKPLFLYWGAEWCPPCAQIKATIFNQREFQERSRLFVPVYLDGDTPSAQKHGERFGVVGYPTMILFRADGAEITRLPGCVDVERYATILDVALDDARPVGRCSSSRTQGRGAVAERLAAARISLMVDGNCRTVAGGGRIATFRLLSERCPVELVADCARLYFEYLYAAADAAEADAKPITGLERAEARKSLLEPAAASPRCAGERGEPASRREGHRGPAVGRRFAGTRQLTAGWTQGARHAGSGGRGTELSAPER